MSLLLLGANQFNVRQDLFSQSEQGLWLDPSDMNATKAGWRRNLLSYSEQFDVTSSGWNPSQASVSANATTAPDGTSTADKLNTNTNNSFHGLDSNFSAAVVSGATYTLSVYAKASEYNFLRLGLTSSVFGSVSCYFDLSNGTVGTRNGGVSASITSVGNGWYRCSFTATATASGNANQSWIYVSQSDNQSGYVGSATSGIFIWGAQLELGSTPTEYQRITDFSTEFKEAFPTHTLYQDSNGVTPCTAAGDPVGLILDQSRGGLGALGPELVTASFPAQVINGSPLTSIASLTAGKFYRVTYTVSLNPGSVSASFRIGLSSAPLISAHSILSGYTGTRTVFLCSTSSGNLNLYADSAGTDLTLSNISVREVPGNHAYQTTSGARPTLARIPSSGRRNLLTYSEQFDNAAWLKTACAISANASTAPDGTNTADRIVANAGTAYHYARQIPNLTGQYIYSVYVKRVNNDFIWLSMPSDAATLNRFNLATGQFTVLGTGVTATAVSIGDGWYRLSLSFNGTIGSISVGIGSATGVESFNAAGTEAVDVWGAQLETGSSATNYQKVVATTDVTESGFNDLWHLVFDGSDDSLVTNSVDFSGTDEMTVIAGVRKLSDGGFPMIVELSANWTGSNGTFSLSQNSGNGYAYSSRGTAGTSAFDVSAIAPVSNVVSGLSDISSPSTLVRVNGVQQAINTNTQGTGNYGNHILYIGRRGGSSLPFNGHLYQLIVRGKTTPTGKLLEAEKFVSKKTGVNL